MVEVRELFAVHGLESTTEAFRRELINVADRRGFSPNYLAAVISFETGGTFDPAEPNKVGSGATGLIQFMPRTAKTLGTTTNELAQMTAVEQLHFVEKHYETVDPEKRAKSVEDVYLAVLSPSCIGYPPSAIMPCTPGLAPWVSPPEGCSNPPKGAYCSNQGLDRNGDGTITTAEATGRIKAILSAAEPLPRIPVPMNGQLPPTAKPEPSRAGTGSGLLAFAGGLAIGYLGTQFAARKLHRRSW